MVVPEFNYNRPVRARLTSAEISECPKFTAYHEGMRAFIGGDRGALRAEQLQPPYIKEMVLEILLAKHKTQMVHRHCANCLKTYDRAMNCSACMTQAYCSKDCQKSHWPTHKSLCKENQAADKSHAALEAVDPSHVLLVDKLRVFTDAAYIEQLPAICSALEVFTPRKLYLTHQLVIYVTHDANEKDPTIAFKVVDRMRLPMAEAEKIGIPRRSAEHHAETARIPRSKGHEDGAFHDIQVCWQVIELVPVHRSMNTSRLTWETVHVAMKKEAVPPQLWEHFNDPDWFTSLQRRLSFPGQVVRRTKPAKPKEATLRDINRLMELYAYKFEP